MDRKSLFGGRLIGAGLLAALSVTPALAQTPPTAPPAAPQAAAWFGLPAPGPATGQVLDFANLDLALPAAPDLKGAPEFDGKVLLGYVKDVVDFSYASRAAGEKTWGRLASSPWAEKTVDYVAERFRAAGLSDIKKDDVPFGGAEIIATDWKVSVLGAPEFGPGSKPIELQSAFPMASRPEGAAAPASTGGNSSSTRSASGPVVYLGDGSAAQIATADLKGKVAVVRIEPAPAIFYSPVIRGLQKIVDAGAVAVIVVYDAPGNLQVHFGSCTGAPCFAVGNEDGDFLGAAIAKAAAGGVLDKLRIEVSLTEETRQNQVGKILVAKIAGESSAENIVVSAHSDAWFSGANDNATGLAALIGLAQHYAKGPKPKHDMYFVVSPGHHSPTGALRRFAELHPKVAPTNILSLNLEHIAGQGVYRSYFNGARMGSAVSKYGTLSAVYVPVNGESPGREVSGSPMTPAVKAMIAGAAARTGFVAPARMMTGVPGEIGSIVSQGATAIQDVETNIWYHTSGDTPEAISPVSLQRVMFFYRDILDQADRTNRAAVRGAPAAP